MIREQTLVIIKPDAVTRGLVGQITERFERKGLKIIGMKFDHIDESLIKEHYAHHSDKPFFSKLVSFMRSAPSFMMVIEGKNVVASVRAMAGTTNASEALPGTIRGDYALSIQQNVVHVSEDLEQAQHEIKRFFKPAELFEYSRVDMGAIYAEDERS